MTVPPAFQRKQPYVVLEGSNYGPKDPSQPHAGFGVVATHDDPEVQEWMRDNETGWLRQIKPSADLPPTRAGEVLERQVRMQELYAGPDPAVAKFYGKFTRAVLEKARQLGVENQWDTGMMFYPYDPYDPDVGRDLGGLLGRQLKAARSYQVTCPMVDAVTALYNKSYRHVQYLEEGELPGPFGFVWLDKPLLFVDGHGKAVSCRALLWGTQEVIFTTDPTGRTGRETVGGVRVTAFTRTDDPDDYATEEDRQAFRDLGFGDLTALHTFVTPFGTRFGGWDKPDDDPGSVPGSPAHTQDDLMAWVHVMWMMMETEISASARAEVPRPVRRRAARTLKHDEVSVITLRRKVYIHDHEVQTRDVDWSCRWMVQGHWRHLDPYDHGEHGEKHHHAVGYQVYGEQVCRTCWSRNEVVRVARVSPYIKGPEGAPLKATGQQLSRLAR